MQLACVGQAWLKCWCPLCEHMGGRHTARHGETALATCQEECFRLWRVTAGLKMHAVSEETMKGR